MPSPTRGRPQKSATPLLRPPADPRRSAGVPRARSARGVPPADRLLGLRTPLLTVRPLRVLGCSDAAPTSKERLHNCYGGLAADTQARAPSERLNARRLRSLATRWYGRCSPHGIGQNRPVTTRCNERPEMRSVYVIRMPCAWDRAGQGCGLHVGVRLSRGRHGTTWAVDPPAVQRGATADFVTAATSRGMPARRRRARA